MPMTSPIGWVYLRSADCTIRWQRGDKVAYIFEGKQTEAHPDEGVGLLLPSPYRLRAGLIWQTSSSPGKIGLKRNVSAAVRAGCIRDHPAPLLQHRLVATQSAVPCS